jgi:polyisoprenoid-binding protein YceI
MEKTQTSTQIKWALDPNHSYIGFRAKHIVVAAIRGQFIRSSGEVLSINQDFSNADITVLIDATSITTALSVRDEQLKGPDFFDVEKFKEIKFKGDSLEKLNEGKYVLIGDLTIKATTKKVKLDVEFGGIVKDPFGNIKAGFAITGIINRKDFGLNKDTILEAGGLMVGEQISIQCEVELIQQKS